MGEIGAIYLLPKALKSYPKSNKSPNLVTLILRRKNVATPKFRQYPFWETRVMEEKLFYVVCQWSMTNQLEFHIPRSLGTNKHLQIIRIIMGCCHSSVDSFALTILPPRAWVPSTPSTLLSFIVLELYLSCEKNVNKQKEAIFGPLAH